MPRDDDHETSDEVRAHFASLVAYFVRAIESLNELPRGPELALGRVWAEHPADLTAVGRSARRQRRPH
jgi:hypothetical protein